MAQTRPYFENVNKFTSSKGCKMIQRVRKAVFPVGGLGTRFLPATKSMPKEMLPVVDKPLILTNSNKINVLDFIISQSYI